MLRLLLITALAGLFCAPPGPAAAAKEVSIAALPPVVVRTVPESGDPAVDPGLTELRVTFSKDMLDRSWSWVQVSRESLPEFTGEVRYLPDRRTCVAPVRLQPGRTYALIINGGRHKSFKDSTGKEAMSYLLVFRTRP